MDLLYVVGASSQWGDHEELRYSMRSAGRYALGTVVVSGYLPTWCTADHVPFPDGDRHIHNVCLKIKAALKSGSIGERFVLMWDDIYLQAPLDERWAYKGLLSQDVERERSERPEWEWVLRAKEATLSLIRSMGIAEPLDFGCHMPVVMERDKALASVEVAIAQPYMVDIKALYWAMHGPEVVRGHDVKMRGWYGPTNAPVFSTGDACEQDQGYRQWIASRFPDPCRYER